MKKLLLTIAGVLIALPAFARDFTYEYGGQTLTYTVLDENAKTCQTKDGPSSQPGNKVSGNLVLPANPKNGEVEYTLTTIGFNAFYKCSGLTSVTIPNSVTSIGRYAFSLCESLTSVNIPNSVTSIGEYAFYRCYDLKTLIIEDGDTELNVGDGALVYAPIENLTIGRHWKYSKDSSAMSTGIKNLTLTNGVTVIPDYAFYECSGLTSVSIPNSVTSIGNYAFCKCSGLKTFIIEDGDTELKVGDWAFDSAPIENLTIGRNWKYVGIVGAVPTGIKNLTLTNGVTAIPNQAFRYCSGLTSVTIPNSVTSIGECAFYKCSGLTSVNIPNSVSTIGESAFYGCSGLTSVNIPNSVSTISQSAFYECSGLTSVNIPNSVSTISQSAFYGCSGLTSVNIPNSVSTIGESAFYGCSGLTSVNIPNSVSTIGESAFYGCSGLTSVNIPESVTSIGESAFYGCSGLTSVNIPNSVTSIASGTFCACSSLPSIEIPHSITSIGDFAFESCHSLTAITIPNSVKKLGYNVFASSSLRELRIEDGDTQIDLGFGRAGNYSLASQFLACELSKVYIGRDIAPVELIHQGAFYSQTQLSEVTFGSSVTSIPAFLFAECTNLESLKISESVKSIGNSAFEGCTKLPNLILPSSIESLGDKAFYNCSALTSLEMGNAFKAIGAYAFFNCKGLPSTLSLPYIATIGDYAFSKSEGLKTVILGPGAESVGPNSFADAGLVKSAYPSTLNAAPTGDGIWYAYNPEDAIFEGGWIFGPDKTTVYFTPYDLKGDLILPNTLTTIPDNCFNGNTEITSVIIPNSVTKVGKYAFSKCSSLKTIVVEDGETLIDIDKSAFNNTPFTNLKMGRNWSFGNAPLPSNATYTFSDFVTSIPDNTFKGNINLSVVDFLPPHLETIGNSAFEDCSNLTSIAIPNSVKKISDKTFYNASKLVILQLGESVETLGVSVFEGCTGLTEISIPNTLRTIGEKAFYNCSNLTSIELKNGLEAIGVSVFEGCTGLTEISIPNTLRTIGEKAFYNLKCIGSLSLDNIETVGAYAFYDNALKSVVLGPNAKSIGTDAFQNCSGLVKSAYPNSIINPFNFNNNVIAVAYNPDGAETENGWVYGAEKSAILFAPYTLEGDYCVPEGVVSIGERAFEGCTGITSLTLPNSVKTVGYCSFLGLNKLISLSLGESIEEIGRSAFNSCSNLTSVNIPNSVKSIAIYAFAYCNKLKQVIIGNGVTSIDSEAFKECSSLVKSAYPNTISNPFSYGLRIAYNPEGAEIENGWVYGAEKSEIRFAPYTVGGDYTIDGNISSVGSNAFEGCSALTSLTFESPLKSIGNRAFYNLKGITSISFGNELESVGNSAFEGCSGLTSISIPNTVKTIGEKAFYNLKSIGSLSLDNIETIGASAFYNNALKSVILGPNAKSIGTDAFQNCSGLVKSAYPNTISNPFSYGLRIAYNPEGAEIENGWVYGAEKSEIRFAPYTVEGEYAIADNVTAIGNSAFQGCTGLVSLVIPGSVTSIGDYAIYNCSGLKTLIIEDTDTDLSVGNNALYLSPIENLTIGRNWTYVGSGAMSTGIKNLTLTNGVTVIPDYAFYGCSGLTSISIPNTVRTIGEKAFYNCSSLTSIELKNGLEAIGVSAFYGCSGLASISIPNTLRTIGEKAFYNLKSIGSLSLDNIETIGASAFYNNALKSVILGPNAKSIGTDAFQNCSGLVKSAYPNTIINPFSYGLRIAYNPEGAEIENGWVYGAEKSEIRFAPYTVGGDYTIDRNISSVGSNAFEGCSALTSLTFESPLKSIGNRAFYNLKGITSISFGNELESVGNSAFEGCSGLTSISIPNTLRTIGEKAFYNLKCIESLSLDNIETIGTSAFYNNALKSVILGPKAKSVGTDAFRNCSGLLKSAYPNTISNPFGYGITVAYNNDDIYNDGFIYGPGQEEIIFAPYYIDGEYSIDGCVSTIADKAFAHCKNMTSVVIPESVSSIGSQAFLGCSALTSVKSFNQNPPVMNDNSFEGRYALATLNLSTEASSRYLATNWSLFENLGSMSGNVFGTYETGNLKYRLIPAPTEDDENLAIVIPGDYVSLTEVTIPQRITVTENGKNVRYFIDGIGYKAFNSGSNLTTVTFNSRNASKTIGEYAFAGTKISAINIPQSVETIHDYAFSNCSALENVEIGSEAKTIGNYAFNKCKSLHAIHIPDKIVRIGDYAFSDCTALKDVEIGSGVKTIGDFAFNNCSAFESIAIPSPVETIGNGAFNSCTSLSNITVSESVKKIGDKAFFETKATKVALSEGLEYIGALAFSANAERNANPIYIPATLQSVGKDAFFNYNCDHVNISDLAAWCNIDFENENANPAAYRNGLYLNDEIIEDLIIPTSAGTVKDYAFYRNSSLKSVSISKDVQSIGTNAFYGDSNLRSIVISGSVLSIGRYAFGNCAASPVVSFEYGSMPVEIGLNAFEAPSSLAWDRPMDGFNLNVSSLKSLAIGNSLTEISDAAFKGISSLTALKLGNSLSAIGDEAFSGCTGLTEVILPPSVETIGASAFAGDTQLTSIIMGHKVTTIGEKAFDLCPAQTVSITAQTPPDAPDNTFSNYTGNLYVQGEDAAEAYYDADFCWFQFEGLVMIEPTDLIVDGDTKISGKPGDTFQLTAKLYPENVTLPHIFWRSTNPDIASVDHNGLVTLHANLDDVMAAAELYDDVSPTTSCKIIGESLYANGPKIELEVNQEGDNSSNLDEIFGSGNNGKIDYTAPVEVYNLSGVRVADSVENLANGIYIIRQGSKVEKIAIK